MSEADGPDAGAEERYEYEAARAKRLAFEVRRLEQELEAQRSSSGTSDGAGGDSDAELRRVDRELERLKSRRSVRVALAVARIAKPVFAWRRRGSVARERVPRPPAARSSSAGDPPSGHRLGPDGNGPPLDLLATTRRVTVIVPIHGAFEELQRCIDSVIRNTTTEARLLLVDDASPDARILPYLEQVATRHPHVSLRRNRENLGFVRTVNLGFSVSDPDDVVVLNSDTEVPPQWLERLQRVAYADPLIATVTPLSNNAGAFSAPSAGLPNPMPAGVDDIGRLVAHHSEHLAPSAPTGNGFCLFIKRAALESVGPFDADAFPRGYGEENDFAMRATAQGWRHAIDDSTFVFHSRSASFKDEKGPLLAEGRAKVSELHPRYDELVAAFLEDPTVEAARRNVGRAIEAHGAGRRGRPRILYVLHASGGGTPRTNADLMSAVADRYEPLLMRSDGQSSTLWHHESGEMLERQSFTERIAPGQFTSAEYQARIARLLDAHAIELVHIRHLQRQTFDLPSVAAIMDVPVVLSFHDFYYCCPTTHLLDETDTFCGGICTPGQGACRLPDWFEGVPHLKHGWVKVWQQHAGDMFGHVDAFVTTSETTRSVYRDVFPELVDADFRVIEHGRDIHQHASLASFPEDGDPIRIALPGHTGLHKGARLVEELQRLDTDRRLEFHVLGSITDEVDVDVVHHGPYERDEFPAKIAEIRPAAIGLFSIWAETYSHTLTEAWSVGVPVIASHLGALGERIEARGGGWLIDPRNPMEAYRVILDVMSDRREWEARRNEAGVEGLADTRQMADAYAALYQDVWARRRAFSSASGG